jgi:hypothetical protein
MTRKGTRVVLVLSAAVLVIVIDRSRKENRVVLVLSAAVLVIVIDARDVGLAGITRVGDLTETQRHGGGLRVWVSPRNDTEDHGNGIGSCSCSAQRCS